MIKIVSLIFIRKLNLNVEDIFIEKLIEKSGVDLRPSLDRYEDDGTHSSFKWVAEPSKRKTARVRDGSIWVSFGPLNSK